jgi:hypothetical protein
MAFLDDELLLAMGQVCGPTLPSCPGSSGVEDG